MTSTTNLPSKSGLTQDVKETDHLLSECAAAFLANLAVTRGRATNTLESYAFDISSLETYLIELNCDLITVTDIEVSGFMSHYSASHSPTSTRRVQSSLKGLFTFLVEEGLRDDIPLGITVRLSKVDRLPKALSIEQVFKLIDSVTGESVKDLRDRAIIELLYGTGMRVTELITLNNSDISFDTNMVKVLGKGSKERFVPLGSCAREATAVYLSEGRSKLVKSPSQQRVFVNLSGAPLTRQGVWSILKSRSTVVGLSSKLSPHVLRHSCATHMIQGGANLRVVQELLGHADLSSTQIYTRVTISHLVETYRSSHPRDQVGFFGKLR